MANISVCKSICLLFVVAAFQPIAITVTLAEQQIPQTNTVKTQQNLVIKDGAYYCYCAYVPHISRYSDFLSSMLTNTGIFLRGLKLSVERRS